VYYSRDALPLVVLGLFRPSRVLSYEAHQLARGRVGSWLQRWCLGRARAVFAVTDRLAADLRGRGARRVIVLRDGFRADRFANLPDRADARRQLHLPLDAFVVGYVGRLETMGMSKGLDVLVRALSRIASPDLHLCLVGGPLDHASALGRLWVQSGLPAGACHVVDDVPPAQIPLFLAAFDVCAMPLPSTPHFDHHASPLKLFEYMAAGRAIVASALPSVAEVVRHGESALLVPPGDADELAGAIARLREDDALRTRLGDSARREATGYAWSVRAARILEELSTSRGQ
jgi:glycosyltransferase involved in cell wall biosynthesis